MPTIEEIRRAICCPGGTCELPHNCHFLRIDVVDIPAAAEAVLRLFTPTAQPHNPPLHPPPDCA